MDENRTHRLFTLYLKYILQDQLWVKAFLLFFLAFFKRLLSPVLRCALEPPTNGLVRVVEVPSGASFGLKAHLKPHDHWLTSSYFLFFYSGFLFQHAGYPDVLRRLPDPDSQTFSRHLRNRRAITD
jgi:hypothetical protein